MTENFRDERRAFLKSLIVAGAAAASLPAATAQAKAGTAAVRPEEKRTAQGYRESAHVKDYYRTAAL